jgi:hypothetical protein
MSAPQYVQAFEGENLNLTITMNAPPAGGVAGWTMLFTLRDGPGVVLTAATGLGVTVTDATAGAWAVAFQVPRPSTGKLKEYTWDFWRTDTGAEFSAAHGSLTVLPRARA